MRITNRYGWSNAWVARAEADYYDRVGDYSTTYLIAPVRMKLLADRHDSEITVDVSDMMDIMVGNAVHDMLSVPEEGVIKEQRMLFSIDGITVSLKPDRIEPIPGTDPVLYKLTDYKTAKVSSASFPTSRDYITQTNIYYYGALCHDIKVSETWLEYYYKDWSKIDALANRGGKYPQQRVGQEQTPIWETHETEAYLRRRIKAFEEAKNLPDEHLPLCSETERWAKKDCFKVYKIDPKTKVTSTKALPKGANFSTRGEADAFAAEKKYDCEIKYYSGDQTRCNQFCFAREFCDYYRGHVLGDDF